MHDVHAAFAQQATQGARSAPAAIFRRCNMNDDARCGGAFGQSRTYRRDEFRDVAAFAQAAEQQQRLALPAAPGALEVHEQDAHAQASFLSRAAAYPAGVACVCVRCSSFPPRTRMPSLRYFSQT